MRAAANIVLVKIRRKAGIEPRRNSTARTFCEQSSIAVARIHFSRRGTARATADPSTRTSSPAVDAATAIEMLAEVVAGFYGGARRSQPFVDILTSTMFAARASNLRRQDRQAVLRARFVMRCSQGCACAGGAEKAAPRAVGRGSRQADHPEFTRLPISTDRAC